MTTQDFFNTQTDEGKILFQTLDELIRKYDTSVTVEVGVIMSVKEALVYKQDGVFKYGLTATKNHYSYHSMVMYAFPDVLEGFKKESKGFKFQKGCFNFNALENIDLSNFESFLEKSAQRDFSPVINHYKQKNK
jgi:hypothetical protein